MKILHVIPSLRKGGAERIALDICSALLHMGHDVKLVTLYDVNHYKFITNNINHERIRTHLKLSFFRKNKVDVSNLQNIIDAFQPEVIHSHLFEAEINLAFCKFPEGIKRVIHFHDNMVQMKSFNWKTLFNKRNLANYYERHFVIKNLTKETVAIAISGDTENYLKKSIPSTVKIIFLHNAIDLKRFYPTSNKSKKNELTMIGSLVPKKGQELAIKTISELKERQETVLLNIIGEGVMLNELLELAEKLSVSELIKFTGIIDYPENVLRESTLYLHTASYEPFGLVFIEAMACGLPVVCTDGKGNRDLIQEGKNGFMVWKRDPKLLADKIQFLLKNEQEYSRISQNAYNFAQNYGMETYTNLLINRCYFE